MSPFNRANTTSRSPFIVTYRPLVPFSRYGELLVENCTFLYFVYVCTFVHFFTSFMFGATLTPLEFQVNKIFSSRKLEFQFYHVPRGLSCVIYTILSAVVINVSL